MILRWIVAPLIKKKKKKKKKKKIIQLSKKWKFEDNIV